MVATEVNDICLDAYSKTPCVLHHTGSIHESIHRPRPRVIDPRYVHETGGEEYYECMGAYRRVYCVGTYPSDPDKCGLKPSSLHLIVKNKAVHSVANFGARVLKYIRMSQCSRTLVVIAAMSYNTAAVFTVAGRRLHMVDGAVRVFADAGAADDMSIYGVTVFEEKRKIKCLFSGYPCRFTWMTIR